jgi:hypothetical protein
MWKRYYARRIGLAQKMRHSPNIRGEGLFSRNSKARHLHFLSLNFSRRPRSRPIPPR